jgi:fermentation-respiration switch protein FrsA (DUF1100 family)
MDGFMFNTKKLTSYTFSEAVIPAAARGNLITLESGASKLKIYGYFVKSPNASANAPTIFYHHGNASNIEAYWDRMEIFYKAGYNTFIYDYRGYGMSEGSSSQQGLEEDAEAALAYLLSRSDVNARNIVLYGYSLGGIPSVYLASKYANSTVFQPRALITEAIYASASDLVQSGSLVDIPGGFVMRDEFNNAERLKSVRCPLLLMHGENDDFIPIERHGVKNWASATNAALPKRFWRIPGANHSTIPPTVGVDSFIAQIKDYTGSLK